MNKKNNHALCHPERSRGICIDNFIDSYLLMHADSSTRPDKSGLGRNDNCINPKDILSFFRQKNKRRGQEQGCTLLRMLAQIFETKRAGYNPALAYIC